MVVSAQSDARPLPEVMLQLVTGYWVSQAVGVVARLGVPDLLAAGRPHQRRLGSGSRRTAPAAVPPAPPVASIGLSRAHPRHVRPDAPR